MKLLPANAAPFIAASSNQIEAGKVALLGIGYDGTTSFRPGTRRGADGFRVVSEAGIETYSPTQDRDLEDIRFSDLGNLDIPTAAPELVVEEAYRATKEILAARAIPIISVSYTHLTLPTICSV